MFYLYLTFHAILLLIFYHLFIILFLPFYILALPHSHPFAFGLFFFFCLSIFTLSSQHCELFNFFAFLNIFPFYLSPYLHYPPSTFLLSSPFAALYLPIFIRIYIPLIAHQSPGSPWVLFVYFYHLSFTFVLLLFLLLTALTYGFSTSLLNKKWSPKD